MTLPVTFATLASGTENASLLDTQFAALGALTFIPCSASGQNAVTLSPNVNTPTIIAYTDLSPVFTWKQAQTSTGSVTILLVGQAALTAYRNNGQTAIGSGDLVAGAAYQGFTLASLNGGAGGFVVDAFNVAATAGQLVTNTVYSASATITIPASASKAYVKMWGSSGGSGGVNNGATGGTGAGGYLEKLLTGLTPGNTLTYTQGVGGAAGSNGPGNGGNGTVTTLASGTQTISTLTANGSTGSALSNGSFVSPGTAGGTATGGDINYTGQNGVAGFATGVYSPGGSTLYASGVTGNSGAGGPSAGLGGAPGGMIIMWLT